MWNATIVKLNTKSGAAATATRRISDGWQSLRNRRLSNSLAPNNGRSWHRQKMCKTSFQGRRNWGDQGGRVIFAPPTCLSFFGCPFFGPDISNFLSFKWISLYSQVPIKRVGPNKRVGWIFIKYFCLSLCLFLPPCFLGAK